MNRFTLTSHQRMENVYGESTAELKRECDLLQGMVVVLSADIDRKTAEVKQIETKLEQAEQQNAKLQETLASQYQCSQVLLREAAREVKNWKESCTDNQDKLQASEATVKTVQAQLAEVEAKFEEMADFKAKFQDERVKRNKELIAVKNENERLTQEQYRLVGFLREFTRCTEFPVENDVDLLSEDVLKGLTDHILKLINLSEGDRDELLWSQDMINQFKNLLNTPKRRFSAHFPSSSSKETEITIIRNESDENNSNNEVSGLEVPISQSRFPHSTSPSSSTFSSNTPPRSPADSQSARHKRLIFEETQENITSTETIAQPTGQATRTTLQTPENVHDIPNDGSESINSNTQDGPSFEERIPSFVIPLLEPQQRAFIPLPAAPPSRMYKQFTEFAFTTKRHGVDRESTQFRCVCGALYQTERGLKVHIQKKTKQWKYKCDTCKQFFYFQYALKNHLTLSKCGGGGTTTGDNGSFNIDELLNLPSQPKRKRRQKTSDNHPTPATGITPGGTHSRRGGDLRKLQQEIFRRKKHAPILSKVGLGAWYCKCLTRFKNRSSLESHVQYFTLEWKFRCEHCQQKFFSLGNLRKHMASHHKISDPLKEYSSGCHLCGEMFRRRTDYFTHKKAVHNIHRSPRRQRQPGLEKLRLVLSKSGNRSLPAAPPSSVIILENFPPPPMPEVIELSSDEDEDTAIMGSSSSSVIYGPQPSVILIESPPASPSSPPSPFSGRRETTSESETENFTPPRSHRRKKHKHRKRKRSFERYTIPKKTQPSSHPECIKIFATKTEMKQHVKEMEYGRALGCLLCSKKYKELEALKNHMVNDHDKVFESFKCVFCSKGFSSMKDFAMHRFNVRQEHQHVKD